MVEAGSMPNELMDILIETYFHLIVIVVNGNGATGSGWMG